MSDFGEGKWVVGIKGHRCEYCYSMIPRGEKHYHFKGKWEGDWQDWRMHDECYDDYGMNCDYDGFCPGEGPTPERIKALYELQM